jgi:hypothetical protein
VARKLRKSIDIPCVKFIEIGEIGLSLKIDRYIVDIIILDGTLIGREKYGDIN